MKKPILFVALMFAAFLFLTEIAPGHGGTYRGPEDTVPPGGGVGGGGGVPGPPSPGVPDSGKGNGPGQPGPVPGPPDGKGAARDSGPRQEAGPDLTQWTFWWEFNKEPYLALKSHVHASRVVTGNDGFFLGKGSRRQAKDSSRPSPPQIRDQIVPALLAALESEKNNDIVTGCLIALAKIGDEMTETGESGFERVIRGFLGDSNQEIAETAAVALGILANDASVDVLEQLLLDDPSGRALVGGGEVPYRTRAFAAYGLSLIGARSVDGDVRVRIVRILSGVLEPEKKLLRNRDIKVACLIALGLVPLDRIEARGSSEAADADVGIGSLVEQVRAVQAYLRNGDEPHLVRAHAPVTLARLIQDRPGRVLSESHPELHARLKQEIGSELLELVDKRSKAEREILQSAVLALGLIGDNDADEIDRAIRMALEEFPADHSDQQARNFAMIALAKVGGRTGRGEDPAAGVRQATQVLSRQLSRGRQHIQTWAGLGLGVLGRDLADSGQEALAPKGFRTPLRVRLAEEKSPARLGAYLVSVGILRDQKSSKLALDKLQTFDTDEVRGYASLSLGLMADRSAIVPIQDVLHRSTYRPELLKQAAIALGLLGDSETVTYLTQRLAESRSLATQASIASALGIIGDSRAVDPLVNMLQDDSLTERARGFAAAALGIVADKELLPWNSKISGDLNYRAATSTLTDSEGGTGILNIL